MARLPRVVIVDVPHHVTQRGNARQVILSSDTDRLTYLELLRENAQLYGLSLLGYCLMSNHVHLIAVPRTPEALAQSLKQAHGRYASYWNAQQSSTGHVWQGRFYSCPLDEPHQWAALRYVEMNPVRARMVESAAARNEEGVFVSLPSEAEGGGESGSGAQVSRTTLLDAAHQGKLSRDCSHREQPAGAPGRRKLDRRTDWALSHPVKTGCSHRRIMVAV